MNLDLLDYDSGAAGAAGQSYLCQIKRPAPPHSGAE